MKRWAGILLGISLALGGCCDQCKDKTTAELQKSSLNRPIVAVVPVIDHSRSHLNWDVSDELTLAVRKRLVSSNHLYLPSAEDYAERCVKATTLYDPFESETGWVKKLFSPNEFVVFMELLQHRETPVKNSEDSPAELTILARVRVFDLRGQEPKLVLEEMIEDSHHIPVQFKNGQVAFGDEAYDASPLGIAHDQLSKQLALRVEDYILIASL